MVMILSQEYTSIRIADPIQSILKSIQEHLNIDINIVEQRVEEVIVLSLSGIFYLVKHKIFLGGECTQG